MKQHICLCMIILACMSTFSTESVEAAIPCFGCHGTSIPIDYRPVDASFRNPSSGGFPGNHRTHMGAPATTVACGTCHPDSNNYNAAHRDGLVKVSSRINSSPLTTPYINTTSAFPQTATPTPGSCSSVNCHFETDTPVWGSATFTSNTDCSKCHGAAPADGTHPKHAIYYGFPATTNSCLKCHADHTADSNPFAHATSAGKRGLVVSFAAAPNNGFGRYTGNLNYPNYLPSQNQARNGVCKNLYCHSPGTKAVNPEPPSTTAVWGGSLACSGCHGNPPSYSDGNPKKNSHGIHGAYSCNKCHYRTTTNGTTITNIANHVNKAYDIYSGAGARFTYAYSTSGGTCTNISCHGSTTAQWGSTACLGCHSVSQGSRAAITGQFGANSHHIQGTLTDGHCFQCHWEANSDGKINPLYHGGTAAPGSTVDLVVYGVGRPASYSLTGTVTAVQYTANNTRGEIAKINTHCLGCHSTVNNAAQPFGDGKTPKQYAWDGKSIADRYSNSNGTQWGKYATNGKSGVSKAFSAHGNAVGNAGGFDSVNGVDGFISNTRGGAYNVNCYDCHNSHGSTVTGITSQYSSATGRNRGAILKDTIAGKGGYAVAYKPYSGGSAANKNKRNPGASLCFDCHMTPDATAGAKPWGYTSTFGASQAIIGYWDTSYFGAGQFPSQARFNYKNSVNMGGHYGQSGALSTQASKAIGGLCTPCHDPHGVSTTLGSNMQYAVPLLKGTFLTSPYNEDIAPANNSPRTAAENAIEYHIDQNTFDSDITLGAVSGIQETDSQFAGLCLQCHGKTGLTNGSNGGTWKSVDRIHESVKDWGLNGKHKYSCSKCHTPHNSRLPKLMVSNCFDYKHKGRVANNIAPATSGSWNGCRSNEGWWDYEFGCGNEICSSSWGSMPGSYSQNPPDWEYSGAPQHSNRTVICHQGQAADQKWNEKTRW